MKQVQIRVFGAGIVGLSLVVILAVPLASIGGCSANKATIDSSIQTPPGPASASSELDYLAALEASPTVTWSDVVCGALVLRGRAYEPAADLAACWSRARAAGLFGATQPDPDPAANVTLLELAAVAARLLGMPVEDDASVRVVITRLDAMGIWPPGTQPEWNATGGQVLSVLAAVNDELVHRPLEAGAK